MIRFYQPIVRCLAAVALSAAPLAAQAPDADEDIRGPKPMIQIPEPEKFPWALWAGVAGGLLLAGACYLIWKKLRRRQISRTPPEIALASLAELEAGREALAAEAFANRAAPTVRQSIADRFGIAAPRRTTEEFLRDLAADAAVPLANESDHLRAFLKSCDLAKFAGTRLDHDQRQDLLQTARDFIRATRANPAGKAP